LITLIEMSDQLRARHDFNLLGAGLSTRPALLATPLPRTGSRLCLIMAVLQ
jgi:hypothetical protein